MHRVAHGRSFSLCSLLTLCAAAPQPDPMFKKVKKWTKDKASTSSPSEVPSESDIWLQNLLDSNEETLSGVRGTFETVGNIKLDTLLSARKLASKGHPISPNLERYKVPRHYEDHLYVNPDYYHEYHGYLQNQRSSVLRSINTLTENQAILRDHNCFHQVALNERAIQELQMLLSWIDNYPCDGKDFIAEQLEALRNKIIIKDRETIQSQTSDCDAQYENVKQEMLDRNIPLRADHRDDIHPKGLHSKAFPRSKNF